MTYPLGSWKMFIFAEKKTYTHRQTVTPWSITRVSRFHPFHFEAPFFYHSAVQHEPFDKEVWKFSHFQQYILLLVLINLHSSIRQSRICTVESVMSGQSRDSISTGALHWSFELLNRMEWHNTVEIESRDCQDMKDCTVIELIGWIEHLESKKRI